MQYFYFMKKYNDIFTKYVIYKKEDICIYKFIKITIECIEYINIISIMLTFIVKIINLT